MPRDGRPRTPNEVTIDKSTADKQHFKVGDRVAGRGQARRRSATGSRGSRKFGDVSLLRRRDDRDPHAARGAADHREARQARRDRRRASPRAPRQSSSTRELRGQLPRTVDVKTGAAGRRRTRRTTSRAASASSTPRCWPLPASRCSSAPSSSSTRSRSRSRSARPSSGCCGRSAPRGGRSSARSCSRR